MNDVTFNKTNGGLGRPLPGEDHYSGLLYYVANGTSMPSGFETEATLRINDVPDLESKGVEADTASFEILHYHVSEFFRLNPNGVLFVSIAEEPAEGSIAFTELNDMINYADGKLRQAGIYVSGETFATSQVTAIQALVAALAVEHKPHSVLFTADVHLMTDLSTLPDLRALTAPNVSVVIGQDGAAAGQALYKAKNVSITCLGALLGAVSLAKVSESVSYVKKFNMSDGTELETPAFSNGDLVKDQADTALDGINTKGYIFLRKHIGITGSYFNDSHCCVTLTSDYAYLENNRTIDKAIRGIRTYVLPELAGPILVNASTGKISLDTAKHYERLASNALDQMARDRDVSGFSVVVNPDQDVLGTSKLVISVAVVPMGVARAIEVNLGFTVKV